MRQAAQSCLLQDASGFIRRSVEAELKAERNRGGCRPRAESAALALERNLEASSHLISHRRPVDSFLTSFLFCSGWVEHGDGGETVQQHGGETMQQREGTKGIAGVFSHGHVGCDW